MNFINEHLKIKLKFQKYLMDQTDVLDMQKQIRAKEALFKKDKAVLEQKVQILELQILESKEREDSIKKMYETMMSALNNTNEGNTIPKELIFAAELHKKEVEELNKKHKESLLEQEKQINELKKKLDEKEANYREMETVIQTQQNEVVERRAETESVKKECEAKINDIREDMKKEKEKLELETQNRIVSNNLAIEKVKADSTREMERIKQQNAVALNDIKCIYEQEKRGIEEKLQKAHSDIINMKKQSTDFTHQESCVDEIRELNSHLDSFKKQSQEEISELKLQKEDVLKKLATAEEELNAMKHTLRNTQNIHEQSAKNYKQKMEQAKQMIEANEKYQLELAKNKKLITELRNTITKQESNERRLKNLLNQKNKENEEQKENQKMKISSERKKALQAHEGFARAKEEYEHKKSFIIQEMMEKDKLINTLSKQLAKYQDTNLTNLPRSANECKSGKKDPELIKELSQLRFIFESVSKMTCKKCKETLETELFIEHANSQSCNSRNSPHISQQSNETINYNDEISQLKKEKEEMAKRLLELEAMLQGSSSENATKNDPEIIEEIDPKGEIQALVEKLGLNKAMQNKKIGFAKQKQEDRRVLKSISTNKLLRGQQYDAACSVIDPPIEDMQIIKENMEFNDFSPQEAQKRAKKENNPGPSNRIMKNRHGKSPFGQHCIQSPNIIARSLNYFVKNTPIRPHNGNIQKMKTVNQTEIYSEMDEIPDLLNDENVLESFEGMQSSPTSEPEIAPILTSKTNKGSTYIDLLK